MSSFRRIQAAEATGERSNVEASLAKLADKVFVWEERVVWQGPEWDRLCIVASQAASLKWQQKVDPAIYSP
jgi:hypothetical protein